MALTVFWIRLKYLRLILPTKMEIKRTITSSVRVMTVSFGDSDSIITMDPVREIVVANSCGIESAISGLMVSMSLV